MTTFDRPGNGRRQIDAVGALGANHLIHQLMPEVSGNLDRHVIGDGLLLCQAGGQMPELPRLNNQALSGLSNAIYALYRTGGPALSDSERDNFYRNIATRFSNFGRDANIDQRGSDFARQLNEYFALQGDPQRVFHVTYVPADNNGPNRLEIRRGVIENNQVRAEGGVLGRPIHLFAQDDRGAAASRCLERIRRTNNNNMLSEDWTTVVSILNDVARTSANRQTGLQDFINQQINPYLHWPMQAGQNFGWHVRLESAGPPIQIQFQQWNPRENRLLREGEPGFQAQQLPVISFPNDAAPAAGGGGGPAPGGPQPGGEPGPPGPRRSDVDQALSYLSYGIGGALGIYALTRLAPGVYNFFRNRRIDNSTLQLQEAQTNQANAQAEAIRQREARMAQRAAEAVPAQRIEVELSEGVRVTLTPEQYARRVEELQRRTHRDEVRLVESQIADLETQMRENPNHPEHANRQNRLRQLQEQRQFLTSRQPRETVEIAREANGRLRIRVLGALGRTLGAAAVLAIVTSVFANNSTDAPRLPTVPN